MFACDGTQTGWVRYGTDGSKKNSFGSTSGIVGTLARDALLQRRPAKVVFRTAGVSDALMLTQLIAATGLADNYWCFTNGAGENERPDKFEPILRPALTGQTVGVIQDNDETGAEGAQRWAAHLAKYAADVCVIELPTVIFDCPVKDLRDFLATDGTTLNDLLFNGRTTS
jgi:lysophospholipase L1-like esterase